MRALPALLTSLSLLACGPAVKGTPSGDAGGPALTGDAVPDFRLVDVNPASARSGQSVGPKDYAGVVTGWYFLHTT